ncbi:MAG: helix-hairpin-helix domain-containing protein [Saprospiraceae bacterium]|nr:helix-hairpin-helix domain-containing protein [Saprospiraceae bacterium]
MPRSISEELYLSKKERTGMFILVALMGLFVLGPYLWKPKLLIQDSTLKESTITLPKTTDHTSKINYSTHKIKNMKNTTKITLKNFDPNQLDEKTAREIGLPSQVFRNLDRYLKKGGRIKSKEQLKKIYGMNDDLYQRLEEFIVLPPITASSSNPQKVKNESNPNVEMLISINASDASHWDQLPAIGEKLSKRIVKFRDALGGFYSTEQVCEVYGITDSVCTAILPKLILESEPKRILLNQSDQDELETHPYIHKKQAEFIIKYRRNHEKIKDMEELKSTGFFEEAWIDKMKHYFAFE